MKKRKTDKIYKIKNDKKKETNEIIIKIKACIRCECDALLYKCPDLQQFTLVCCSYSPYSAVCINSITITVFLGKLLKDTLL
jgi:hypothetical protein